MRLDPERSDPAVRGRFGRVGGIGAGGWKGADAPITSRWLRKRAAPHQAELVQDSSMMICLPLLHAGPWWPHLPISRGPGRGGSKNFAMFFSSMDPSG